MQIITQIRIQIICVAKLSVLEKTPYMIIKEQSINGKHIDQLNFLGRLFCSRYTLSLTSTTIASFNLFISRDLGFSFMILSNGVSTPNSFVIFLKIFIFPSFSGDLGKS